MEAINSILSGIILPLLLIICGIWFAVQLRFFYILHPMKLLKNLFDSSGSQGISPFKALTVALAGTLGVGNMAGVATAISAGGAGALFWMWISALCAMSIKYYEVRLALETRVKTEDGFRGGAMYYIKKIFGGRIGSVLGSGFAVMCAVNSLLTGNIVQVNSACAAFGEIDTLLLGLLIGILALWIAIGGGKRVSGATVFLVPILSAVYMIICLAIIFNNVERIPEVMKKIFRDAFSLRAAGGGIGSFMLVRAMRFGVTRGLFSNEAGCGTSPTAHAMADAKSPHHQGCFGIFEVFADTIVLCTMTGIVILLCDGGSLDGIPLTLYAFRTLAGNWAANMIAVSVVLFAFATVISQSSYGMTALEFLKKRRLKSVYLICIPVCAAIGSVISAEAMWHMADLTVSLMTLLNLISLSIGVKNANISLDKRRKCFFRESLADSNDFPL